jgi:restriction endonuclease S subunit
VGAARELLRQTTHKQIQEIEIPLPPLEVQETIIAEILGYENKISQARENINSFDLSIQDLLLNLWNS